MTQDECVVYAIRCLCTISKYIDKDECRSNYKLTHEEHMTAIFGGHVIADIKKQKLVLCGTPLQEEVSLYGFISLLVMQCYRVSLI